MTTKQIMEEYEKAYPARKDDAGTTMRVMTLLTQYRDLSLELAPQLATLDAVKKELGTLVLELGAGVEVEGASASIRSGYTRATWDGDRLDGFAVVCPEILVFRKESVVKPSVTVKVAHA